MASVAVTKISDLLDPIDSDRVDPTCGLPRTAAVAGQPIHPMVVPYPVAFLTGAIVGHRAAHRSG